MKKQSALLFPLIAVLAACAPTMASRGNMLDPELCAQIKPGMTREEVATRLGTPTAISTVDENTWYYVGRETEQYSFFTPKVLQQRGLEIDFNNKGIVTAVAPLDLSQAADAEPVDRATPTFGQKDSILREIIGDLKHPRPVMDKQRGSGT